MAEMIMLAGAVFMGAGLFFALYRFAKGPDTADRVVAFDTLTVISLPLIALLAHTAGRTIYLDVAVVYGLLSFIGVIVVARYIERRL